MPAFLVILQTLILFAALLLFLGGAAVVIRRFVAAARSVGSEGEALQEWEPVDDGSEAPGESTGLDL